MIVVNRFPPQRWLASAAGLAFLSLRLRWALAASVPHSQWLPVLTAALLGALAIAVLAQTLAHRVFGDPGHHRFTRIGSSAALMLIALGAWQISQSRFSMPAFSGPSFVQSLSVGGQNQTRLPFVTAEVASTADSSPASAVLRPATGADIAPFGGSVAHDGQLHRLNFRPPSGKFMVVPSATARVQSVVAYAWSVRIAGKLFAFWPWVLALAAASAAIGAGAALRPLFRARCPAWTASQARSIAVLLLIPYLYIAGTHLDLYAGGADSSGYLNNASLLRHGHLGAPLRRVPNLPGAPILADSLFVPPGFILHPARFTAPATLSPTYPLGLPLLIAAASVLLPPAAATAAVILLHLVAGLILIYILARQFGFTPAQGLGLAAVLALSPVYLFMGLQPMSDVPALVWVAAAVAAALSPRPLLGAALSGAAAAMAILVRPSNVLALPVIALAAALNAAPASRLRRCATFIAAAAPFAALEAYYNHRLFGHALTTGYGNPAGLFAGSWIPVTLLHYVDWLPKVLSPAILAIVFLPFLTAVPAKLRALVLIWAVPLLAFYAAYYCTHETWWYLRFLLPAFPALLLGAILVTPRRLHLLALLITLGLLVYEGFDLGVLDSGRGNRVYADASQWLMQSAPANALVVCDIAGGALTYYTDRTFVIPQNTADADAIIRYAAAAHSPIYAVFFVFDARPLSWFTGHHWQPAFRSGDMSVWRLF